MRLNHVPCPESLPTPIIPKSLPTRITQYKSLCVIKSIIYGLHPMIISQNKFIYFQTKIFFGCYTPMIICIQTHVSFVGNKFSGSHRKVCTPSDTFWTFTIGVFELVRVFHPRENLALLAITQYKFFSISCNCTIMLDFVQRYRAHLINHQT